MAPCMNVLKSKGRKLNYVASRLRECLYPISPILALVLALALTR